MPSMFQVGVSAVIEDAQGRVLLMRRAISKDFEALEWEPVTGAWNRASRLRAQFSGRSSKRLADRGVKDTPCSPRTRRSVDLLRSPPDHDPDDPKRTRSILCRLRLTRVRAVA